ncbi:MAG: hypothetical protein K2J17_02645 [Paramuribaculum sp.]|nr:hypothetical protein [Paramuribaculum sp.]
MSIFFTILTICAVAASLAGVFLSWRWSAIPAWLALVPMYFIDGRPVTGSTLLFWGVACAIALGINVLLPQPVVRSRVGMPYMVVGALAGAFAGMLMPLQQAGMILGAVAGLLLGAIAYSRTPSGPAIGLLFPTRRWFNYTCAKGFPVVVTIATAAIAIMAVVRISYTPVTSISSIAV